jgi:hypothetical protein
VIPVDPLAPVWKGDAMRTGAVILCVSVVMLAASRAAADDVAGSAFTEAGRFTAGVRVGASWSSTDASEHPPQLTTGSLRHLAAGIELSWRVHRHLALELAPTLAGMGHRYRASDVVTDDATIAEISGEYRLRYLELPLTVRGIAPITPRLSVHAFAGGSFGILLSADDGRIIIADSFSNNRSLTDELDRTQVSAVAGAGVAFSLDHLAVSRDASYQHGVSAVDRDNGDVATPADAANVVSIPPIRNRALFITSTIRFLSFD